MKLAATISLKTDGESEWEGLDLGLEKAEKKGIARFCLKERDREIEIDRQINR